VEICKRRVIEVLPACVFVCNRPEREHFVENRIPRNRLQEYISEISAYRQAYIRLQEKTFTLLTNHLKCYYDK